MTGGARLRRPLISIHWRSELDGVSPHLVQGERVRVRASLLSNSFTFSLAVPHGVCTFSSISFATIRPFASQKSVSIRVHPWLNCIYERHPSPTIHQTTGPVRGFAAV